MSRIQRIERIKIFIEPQVEINSLGYIQPNNENITDTLRETVSKAPKESSKAIREGKHASESVPKARQPTRARPTNTLFL